MVSCSILLTVLALSAAPQFEARLLKGPLVAGAIVELDAKRATLETPAGRVSLETAAILDIYAKPKPAGGSQAPAVWIDLLDGSTVAALQYASQKGHALITLPGGETVDLPAAAVAAVRFQPAAGATGQEWARLRKLKGAGDLLAVNKTDVFDYHRGTIRDVSDKTVEFELDGDLLPVKRANVFGLIYQHPAEEEPAEPLGWITDADGSHWAVRTMSLAGKLQWTTVGGAKVSRPLDQVAVIDLSGGKVVFLSDLKPESLAYTPFFPLEKELPARLEFFRLRQDQNLESKPLRTGGKQFRKGLALHSRTEAVYYLPGRFRRFEAIAGIDDDMGDARQRGSVHLILRGDDKLLWEAVLSGADKEPFKSIDLDVTGVRRLTIVADFTGDLDVAGHVVLGDARVSK